MFLEIYSDDFILSIFMQKIYSHFLENMKWEKSSKCLGFSFFCVFL